MQKKIRKAKMRGESTTISSVDKKKSRTHWVPVGKVTVGLAGTTLSWSACLCYTPAPNAEIPKKSTPPALLFLHFFCSGSRT